MWYNIRMRRSHKGNRGFTLVELLVCIGIFVFMTGLLVAKYGNFNQSVLLTDIAYDAALVVRTAQTYGLSVKGNANVAGSCNQSFQCSYGIHFSKSPDGNANTKMILYAVLPTPGNANYDYEPGNTSADISTYAIRRGGTISDVCVGPSSTCTVTATTLDIVFKRPDPTAIICAGTSCNSAYHYAKITIKGTDNSTRGVEVRNNGQISVVE